MTRITAVAPISFDACGSRISFHISGRAPKRARCVSRKNVRFCARLGVTEERRCKRKLMPRGRVATLFYAWFKPIRLKAAIFPSNSTRKLAHKHRQNILLGAMRPLSRLMLSAAEPLGPLKTKPERLARLASTLSPNNVERQALVELEYSCKRPDRSNRSANLHQRLLYYF